MRPCALVVALAVCLAGCRTKPASSPADPGLPGYSGTVGQLEEADAFMKFVDTHDRQTVDLNLTLANDVFEGGEEPAFSFFVVYDDCDTLPAGQKPGQPFCTGVEYNIPHSAIVPSAFTKDGTAWHLRGRFRVEHAAGQHQGLMSVTLTPATPGSAGVR